MASYGGIDLGGTKIQAVIVDERPSVLGSARRPTPDERGPGGRGAARWRRRCATPPRPPSSSRRRSTGIGVGSPGAIEGGNVTQRPQPARLGRHVPAGEGRSKARSVARLGSATTCRSRPTPSSSWAPARPYESLLGVFWGTGVGGGLILDGKPWIGRGGAGEIGHMVVKIDGARCTCGRRGCMEAYAGRAAMEDQARKLQSRRARKTDLFKLMKEHERTRLTSGIWARALEHGDKLATELIERAVRALGAGIASAVNLLDVEAVIIGGGLGVRLGDPYAEADRRSDAAAPVRRRPAPACARGGARRSRRRDRRGAALLLRPVRSA